MIDRVFGKLMMQPNPDANIQRKNWKQILTVIRLGVIVLIAWGVWRTVDQARDDFAKSQFSLSQVNYVLLTLAGMLYVIGMMPAAVFWWQSLRVMGQAAQFGEAIRAYFVGGLGKYVPGKVAVVYVRSDMVRRPGVDWRVAAVSVFVETLTLMAVGAFMGAILIAISFPEHRQFLLGAFVAAFAIGIPSLPPVFRRIVRWIAVRKGTPTDHDVLKQLNLAFMSRSWLSLAFGWLVMGLSLLAILHAIPNANDGRLSFPRELALTTACVALAVVAGFVTMTPAGLGAREYVIIQLLGPIYGEVTAIIAAALMRLVWLVSEFTISVILYFAIAPPSQSNELPATSKIHLTSDQQDPSA